MKNIRFRSYILITIIAAVVWLFAESETLSQETVTARISFGSDTAGAESGWFIHAHDWSGQASVTITGSSTAIADAREMLTRGIVLGPGTGLEPTNGEREVPLMRALQSHPRFVETGAVIELVRPDTAAVMVQQMVPIELPVQAQLPGVATEGDVVYDPPTISAVVRADIREQLPTSLPAALASVPEQATQGLPRSGPAELEGLAVTLPAQLRDLAGAGVRLVDREVAVQFQIAARLQTLTTRAPVWVQLPQNAVGSWNVTINSEDRFLQVELAGPPENLARFAPGSGDSIVAVLSLDSTELQAAVTDGGTKTIRLATKSGTPLPTELEVTASANAVRFSVSPVPAATPSTAP